MTKRPAIIDLFAGAGGLGIGAEMAGGDLRLSVDNDLYSCQTLETNAEPGHVVVRGDISELTEQDLREASGITSQQPLIVVGGAPCQPFSKAAYWTDAGQEAAYRRARARGDQAVRSLVPIEARPDSRRTLVNEYWRLVEELRPEGFVFENVPSILHPRNKHVFAALRADAEAAGYQTTVVHGKATSFGVAQARQRIFLLGSREAAPKEPTPTHSEHPSEGRLPIVTTGSAIGHLSGPEHHEPEETVKGRWADHLAQIPPGMNYKWHTAWAGHPDPTFETETRFWNFLLKLSPDKPSWTIPASPGPWTGPFHWDGRRLRISELAILQGFPEGHTFCGPRREQIRQIGNAVPAPMAAAMIESVIRATERARVAA